MEMNVFNNLKNQKDGITLIALVITIIVLLILAGVSIATLTGQNGILTRASESKIKTELEQAREAMKLLVNGWQIEKNTNNSSSLEEYLKERVPSELDKVTKNADGTFTVEVNGYEGTIDANGELVGELAKETDPSTDEGLFININKLETNPEGSMPNGATVVEENGKKLNDANEGIVVKDKNNNEWVWVEVPKSEMPTGLTFANDDDYNTLTTKLKGYASPYTEGSKGQGLSWIDEWYDKLGTTYDGENEYSQVKYADSSDNFNVAKTYYGTIYTDNQGTTLAESYTDGTTYYVKIAEKLNNNDGCGLTYNQYQETYQTMLKSIYTNGGFWIARYEAGIEGTTGEDMSNGRTNSNKPSIDINTSPKAISQKDAIPYNYVYCSEAQKLSNAMSENTGKTTSLLFGIQWDLVCKFFEEKEVKKQGESKRESIKESINLDSGEWGNYMNKSFPVANGKYFLSLSSNGYGSAATWQKIPTNYTKPSVTGKLGEAAAFSTGIVERNCKLNIYDFAGNVVEWTLEHSTLYVNSPYTNRGGYFSYSLSTYPASWRGQFSTAGVNFHHGFRVTLY